MILALKTDSPVAELVLLKPAGTLVAHEQWQADRRLADELLGHLETFLQDNDSAFEKLTGLTAYEGPGSFTGLRIGITTMNTMAYALEIPIVGARGESWLKSGSHQLVEGKNTKIVTPHYGAEARITKPKK